MPGSKNNKLTPQPPLAVAITRKNPGASLREPLSLSVTAKSEPKARVEGDNLTLAPGQMRRPGATDQSNSVKNWANAMRFFEVNPYASAEQAASATQWFAEKQNNQYNG